MKSIHCFIPYESEAQVRTTLHALQASPAVSQIVLLTNHPDAQPVDGCELLQIDTLYSTATWQQIAAHSDAAYTLVYQRFTSLHLGPFALSRMIDILHDTAAGFVYADHYLIDNSGNYAAAPLIDYQQGSLRDDFDFGSLLLFDTAQLKTAARQQASTTYQYAGWYDLRLHLSESTPFVHINELLYATAEQDHRKSGEKLFDYVDPKNRARQIEMEAACTLHLKRIGGWLPPHFLPVDLHNASFPHEASVIIPVRNRVRTIRDAIQSVLNQQTSFSFNLIIVDNHSTDGTTELIRECAASDPRIVHLLPERNDLGIGGCWNLGVHHHECGKFAIQLDSDDVYSGTDTLQKIVDAFYAQECVMLVGTYRMTNFTMEEIPPGVIDHREWTPDNGRNNALRINGLGAPRAFFTPILRKINLPNTSYGEDYAVGLRISRQWQIGRIYDVLYLCRRWDENSDAALDRVKMNAHNTYKDRLRTWELQARIQLNREKETR